MRKRIFQPLPYVKWFPGDALKDTMHLTNDQFGTYCFWLNIIYATGQPLPNDDAQLRMLGRVPEHTWPHIKKTVLEHYFHLTPDGWFKTKCAEVMDDVRKTIDANTERARKGGQASAKARRDKQPSALDEYGFSEPNPSSTQVQPKSNHPEPEPEPDSDSKSNSEPKPEPKRLAYNKIAAQEKGATEPDNFPVAGETWEQNLMRRCSALFPEKEMARNGGLWRGIARRDPDTLNRVLLEIGSMKKEGFAISKLPACAMDLYARFGGKMPPKNK